LTVDFESIHSIKQAIQYNYSSVCGKIHTPKRCKEGVEGLKKLHSTWGNFSQKGIFQNPTQLFNMSTFLEIKEVGHEGKSQAISVDIDHGSGVSYCHRGHDQSPI
jgi:hypothetical protein